MKTLALTAAVALLTFSAAQAQAPTGPTGTWLTASGNLEVKVAPCGPALCGTVVRVLARNSMSKPGAAMASSEGVGLKILTGLMPRKDGIWVGKIYNRENGKTYDCRISMASRDQMELRAYLGVPALGKSQMWKRVR